MLLINSASASASAPSIAWALKTVNWNPEAYLGESFRLIDPSELNVDIYGPSPLTVSWYLGVMPGDYDESTDFDNFGTLLYQDSIVVTEPLDIEEGYEEYNRAIYEGPQEIDIDSIPGIFVVIRNSNGIHASQFRMKLPIRINEERPTLEILSWYEGINHVTSGDDFRFEMDAVGANGTVEKRLYWGKEGDRSNPIISKIPSFPGPTYWPVTIVVPDEVREFWGEAWDEIGTVTLPTATLTPLPNSEPIIIGQPTELFVSEGSMGVWFDIYASGGNLTFEGVGAELMVAPVSYGNHTLIGVGSVEPGHSFSVAVSNQLGSTVSDPILISAYDSSFLGLSDMPNIVSLSDEQTSNQGYEHSALWFKPHLVRISQVQLVSPSINKPLSIKVNGVIYNEHRQNIISVPIADNSLNTLPDDIYQLRVEFVDGTIKTSRKFRMGSRDVIYPNWSKFHFASTLRYANPISNGGTNNASVMIKGDLNLNTMKVVKYVDENPVEIAFTYSIDKRINRSADLSRISVSWIDASAFETWFIGTLSNGREVKTKIKRTRENFIYSPTESIELPVGADYIPFPTLTESIESWNTYTGVTPPSKTTLPLSLNNILGQLTELSPELKMPTGNPPVYSITINKDLPPQILNQSTKMPVVQDSFVLKNYTINGWANKTEVFESTDGENWEKVLTKEGRLDSGFQIESASTKVKISIHASSGTTDLVSDLVRIPDELLSAFRVLDFFDDTAFSPIFGAFHNLSYYPWLNHDEWGWAYILTAGETLYIYGDLIGNGYQWFATSASIYPFLQELEAGDWIFTEPNKGGLHFNFSLNEWHQP